MLFQNYFKGTKTWWLFAELYQNPTDWFVLKVLTQLCRFQKESVVEAKRMKKIGNK